MKAKWLAPLFGLILALALLAGCGPAGEEPTPPPTSVPTATPAPTPTPEPTPEPTPSMTVIDNRDQLKAYLISQTDSGADAFTFRYTGNTNLLTEENLMQMTGALHVAAEKDKEDREIFTLTLTPFPGDRMAEAYLSGDTSGLSADERTALDAAIAILDSAKAEAGGNPIALELALHNAVCDRADYLEKPYRVKDPAAPPNYMTCLGVLLDGQANSFGYADAFCLLATMAGFETDRMCGNDERADPTMFNTIRLEGSWYVVNAAYNDRFAANSTYKFLFNAGLDASMIYGWGIAQERRTISLSRYEDRETALPAPTEVADLHQLCQFLNDELAQDRITVSFRYTGPGSDLISHTLMEMTGSSGVALHVDPEDPTLYYASILQRPGDRIVDAYFSGDTSRLSDDELLTMDIALDMLAAAQAKADNLYELELELHDALVRHMTYNNNAGEKDIFNVPRIYTAIGGLVDGQGNCQSYTDSFYLLATLAGFEVGRQVVDVDQAGDHICNTILLDGKWYIVDVTFDDPVNYTGPVIHQTYNVGKDRAKTFYSWRSELEYHPIAPTSNQGWLYHN